MTEYYIGQPLWIIKEILNFSFISTRNIVYLSPK